MKRDMNLVRKILFEMEEHEHGLAPRKLEINNYTEEQVLFHIWLMGEAGLLKVSDASSKTTKSPAAIPICMRWKGYEFLEAAREPSRWKAAIEKIFKSGAGMTFEVLKSVLVTLSKEALELR